MKVSRCCVQETVKKHKETGTVVDKCRSGCPKASTEQQDCELVTLSLQERRATVPELKPRWAEASGVFVSAQKVHRRLCNKGLRGCVAAKKAKTN